MLPPGSLADERRRSVWVWAYCPPCGSLRPRAAALKGLHASIADLVVANSTGSTLRACHSPRCGGLPAASGWVAALPASVRAGTGPAGARPQAERGLTATAVRAACPSATPVPCLNVLHPLLSLTPDAPSVCRHCSGPAPLTPAPTPRPPVLAQLRGLPWVSRLCLSVFCSRNPGEAEASLSLGPLPCSFPAPGRGHCGGLAWRWALRDGGAAGQEV